MKTQPQKWDDFSPDEKRQVKIVLLALIIGTFIFVAILVAWSDYDQPPAPLAVTAQSKVLAAQSEPAPPPIFREITDIKEARYLAERTLQVMESAYPALVDAITLQDWRGKYVYVDDPLNEITGRWPNMIQPKGETDHFAHCVEAARALQSVSNSFTGRQQTTGSLKFIREAEARYIDGLGKCKRALSQSDSDLRALQ